jgi:hypothetical protein
MRVRDRAHSPLIGQLTASTLGGRLPSGAELCVAGSGVEKMSFGLESVDNPSHFPTHGYDPVSLLIRALGFLAAERKAWLVGSHRFPRRLLISIGVPGGIRTRVNAVKARDQNATLTHC